MEIPMDEDDSPNIFLMVFWLLYGFMIGAAMVGTMWAAHTN